MYGQLSYDKGAKNTQWGKDSVFYHWCWGNWTSTSKTMQYDPYLTPQIKINSQWIKDLDRRTKKNVKLLEENIGKKLLAIGLNNDFLDVTPKLEGTQGKIDKKDYIQF